MKLYHGSSHRFENIRASQAKAGLGLSVPDGELLRGVYLTPNYDFALAIGAMPDGRADIDDEKKEITFENPELFDTAKPVYIYEVDSEKLPKEHLLKVDNNQYVVKDLEELKPDLMQETTAGELLRYYKVTNLVEHNELTRGWR